LPPAPAVAREEALCFAQRQEAKGGYTARELVPSDFEEHLQLIALAEDSLRNFRRSVAPGETSSAAPPLPPQH